MANFIEIMGLLQTTSNNMGYEYIISDGFEIQKQSQSFKKDKIYIIRDVGNRNSNNIINGYINNSYPINLWFVKNFNKDNNQESLDVIHSELKSAVDSFMFTLNKNSALKAANIQNYNDSGSKITDNYFYAINVNFNFSTQCNL